MNLVTPQSHISFCLSSDPVGCARSCRSGLPNYWSMVHFHLPLPSYHPRITPLSSKDVKIKEDFCAWYQGLGYEEGFGANKVLSF